MIIRIRELEIGDLKRGFLKTLENLSDLEGLGHKKAREIFEYITLRPSYHVFVAEIEGQVVGAITLLVEQKFTHNGGKVGYIEDVVTRKGWERRGIGRALVSKALEQARQEGCYKIVLECSEDYVSFYEKFGFELHSHAMRLDLT